MHRSLRAIALLGLLVQASRASGAMILQSYDPARHDRFYVGADKNFLGEPFDFSGVGRDSHWATMISESYFVSAAHFHPAVDSTVRFYETNDPAGPYEEHVVASGVKIGESDLWIGKLATPVGESIAKYPVLEFPDAADYSGQEIYTFGRSNTEPTVSSVRLGRNVIDPGGCRLVSINGGSSGMVFLFDFDNPGLGADESYLQPQDSGGPSFVIQAGTPALAGIHWFIDEDPERDYSGDTCVGSYVDEIIAAMVGESPNVVPRQTLVWNGQGDGPWTSSSSWLFGDSGDSPDAWTKTVVRFDTVTVTGAEKALYLLVNAGGGVVVADGGQLDVRTDFHITGGALAVEGAFAADAAELISGSLSVGPLGEGDVRDNLGLDSASALTVGLDGRDGGGLVAGRVTVGGTVDLHAGSTLSLEARGSSPTYGPYTLTIVDAGQIAGTFGDPPQPNEHLGFGLFHRGVDYGNETIAVEVFQAAPGDTNGNGSVDGFDIQAILSAAKFGRPIPAGWGEGDFTGNGFVDGFDIQAILSTNLFGKGLYGASEPAAVEQATLALEVTPDGLTIDTHGTTINGYLLTSQAGILTGDPADNLGLFTEDTDFQASGNFGFTLLGRHELGDVIAEAGLGTIDLVEDLSFTYTIEGQPGVYAARLVPEPGAWAMLAGAAWALLLVCRLRRRRVTSRM